MQLKEQAAIVTGGASGLGAATARRLAKEGAKVAVFDLNTKLAETVAGESADRPGNGGDQGQDGHECKNECQRLHTWSPPNRTFFMISARRTLIEGETNGE